MLLAGFAAGRQSDSDALGRPPPLPSVIASEARQSMAASGGVNCFVASAPRNDSVEKEQNHVRKGPAAGKADIGHRRRLRAWRGDGTPLRRAWRRTDHLRPTA